MECAADQSDTDMIEDDPKDQDWLESPSQNQTKLSKLSEVYVRFKGEKLTDTVAAALCSAVLSDYGHSQSEAIDARKVKRQTDIIRNEALLHHELDPDRTAIKCLCHDSKVVNNALEQHLKEGKYVVEEAKQDLFALMSQPGAKLLDVLVVDHKSVDPSEKVKNRLVNKQTKINSSYLSRQSGSLD